jgi:hypothetical protein
MVIEKRQPNRWKQEANKKGKEAKAKQNAEAIMWQSKCKLYQTHFFYLV